MESSYKLIIYNKKIFREIELPIEKSSVVIGTEKHSDFRFNKELFFDNFEFTVKKLSTGAWQLRCGANLYLSDVSDMKFTSKGLNHGDSYSLRYQSSNHELFKIVYTLNYDLKEYNFDRYIDLNSKKEITFGADKNCNVCLSDALLDNSKVAILKRNTQGWSISDIGSKHGVFINTQKTLREETVRDYDFFSILGFRFFLKENFLYYDSSYSLSLNSLESFPANRIGSSLVYPKFNRNTRLKYVVSTEKIAILDPEKKPEKPKNNLITSILPAVASLFLILTLRGGMLSREGNFLSNLSENSFILFSAATMCVGMLTTVLTAVMGKKDYYKSLKKRENIYLKYIENKGKEVDELRQQEADLLNDIYISLDEELQQVKDFSGDLFDKSLTDDDFMRIRLGLGSVESRRPVDFKKKETLETTDILISKPEDLYNEFKNVDNVPVVANFRDVNAVGVVGDSLHLYQMMKNMIIDICVRHHYNDVKLFAILDENDAEKFSWIRWFQNFYNEKLDLRNIVCDDESKNTLFEYLYIELSKRENEKINYPHTVVMVFDDVGIKLHPVSKYIQKANQLGFTFVFFENYKELLPQGCQEIILLNSDGITGKLIPAVDVNSSVNFNYSNISDENALYIAQRLASVYCEEVSLENALTKNITLFELMNILSVNDIDLKSNWNNSKVYKSMAAPLGVKTKNEIVYLDLHEKTHGPHGLVAGTTGSGKSEILQTYILSMATLYHPHEVGFVIIDFKGGGMANQFVNLPHLIGTITNIDGDEIERSLLSIKAELLKRQNLFSDAGVNHIDQYIKLYKETKVEVPLPHLIIVVDEFAELKAEQPEFMKELISAARIGRSLGVHLILATQKPAGQVNEQIWSNSKFKLCLKVQTKEDSNEVLKSPLAAEIKEPGRAYLQVGNNEIFELFQSAYSGANACLSLNSAQNEFVVSEVLLSGVKRNIYEIKNQNKDAQTITQLKAVVDYVDDYCKQSNTIRLPNICLPPLSEIIEITEADICNDDVLNSCVPIGIYDDPNHQYQGMIDIDLAENNVMIIGSSRYGKTNTLQIFIRSLAERFSPEEVNIYILDFASMVLKNFESLNHVGGIICSSDDEKLKNFFKLIFAEIAERKKKLIEAGVSSFTSYREAGYTNLPQIVIIVDNLTALKEMYLQDDDPFLVICREGVSVGISVIVANAQTTGIGYRYFSNFSARIALYCNDSSEYSSVFEACRTKPKNIPGRCVISREKDYFQCQIYRAFNGEKEIDRVKSINEFINRLNTNNPNSFARKIPAVPDKLDYAYLENNYSMNNKGYVYPIGLDYENVELVSVDLRVMNELSIIGKNSERKLKVLNSLLSSFHNNIFSKPVKLYIVDSIERPLREKNSLSYIEKYTIDYSEIGNIFDEILPELEERLEMFTQNGYDNIAKKPMVSVIINNKDAIEYMSTDKVVLEQYKKAIKRYKNVGFSFIFADVDDVAVGYNGAEILKQLKENKKGIITSKLSDFKFCEIPTTAIRNNKSSNNDDCFLMDGSEIKRIKIAEEDTVI